MERRFVLFLVLSFAVLLAHSWLMLLLRAPQPADRQAPGDGQVAQALQDIPPADGNAVPAQESPTASPGPSVAPPAVAALPITESHVALGSADPASSFHMVVYLTSRGAAVERVALNSPQFTDMDERVGYLGYLALTDVEGGGCRVRVLGADTPAARGGLMVGDVVRSINGRAVARAEDFEAVLRQAKPGQSVTLGIRRADRDEEISLSIALGTNPLEVLRPEWMTRTATSTEIERGLHDPLSFLLTIAPSDERRTDFQTHPLGGVDPQSDHWRLESSSQEEAVYSLPIEALGLRLVKRYRLARREQENGSEKPAHHLTLGVSIENTAGEPRTVLYRLHGPTGLPTEGWWYANKVSRGWGAAGLRDVAYRFRGSEPALATRAQIVTTYEEDTLYNGRNRKKSPENAPLEYVGVDAQYFAAVLIPRHGPAGEHWISEAELLPVGEIPKDKRLQLLSNISFRLTSRPLTLPPGGHLTHEYQVFLGPKQPTLLSQYGPPEVGGLTDLVYYGWFSWAARPMVALLHALHRVVRNYGIAIVLLTVLVRSCMLPVSRKQALAAQKMQELQPEMKRIAEKYKNNVEQRTKAQQELFRKHNYNPLGGCLLLFVQLPIFIGLYRALMVDVELRQAPLIADSIRWCSNLAAPDMLFRWDNFMPAFLAAPQGWFGPYFNLLPLLTVALFLWQTIMFTPPPADDQQRAQANMMKFMTLFMGLLFFKVASGLCLYFIASSLWGIAERKLVPKGGKDGGGAHSAASRTPAARDVATRANGPPRGKKLARRGRPAPDA